MDPIEPVFTVEPPQRPVPQPPRRNRGGIVGVLAAIGAVLVKFGGAILIFAKTGLTMLLSIGAYSLIFGWKFAVGLVVLIFMHEMGHFVAAKFYRVPVTAPMFIPFFGAYVLLSTQHLSNWTNAMISYAGPLAGALGGWACYALALAYGSPHWLVAVALYTFILNIINLAPIVPLDGSKVWIAFSSRRTPDITPEDRIYMGFFVAALLAGLVLGVMETWGNLPPAASFR